MSKKARLILFLICLILFLIIAPLIVFYSLGYRIQWDPLTGGIKISRTGGLFLNVWPNQAEVYLDSELKKETDFFFGSALIENLLPQKYKIQVRRSGFHPWEKQLEIEEKKVTAAKNIILFPQNPNFTVVGKDIEQFWFLADERKIIIKEISKTEGWALKLYDLERELKSHLARERDFYQGGADLLELEFSEDSKNISLEIGLKEQIKCFLLNIERIPPLITEEKKDSLPLENIITYQKFNEEVYYLGDLGHLFKTDKTFKPKTKLTEVPFSILPETEYKLEIFEDFIFLKEDKTLYFFNVVSKSFEKFFEPTNALKLSPDSKKIVYFSDYEIWILFLKEKESQLPKEAGEKVFLMRLSEKIQDVSWLNSDYLIFTVENKIKITEIDERDKINIIDFAQFEQPEVSFNQTNKKIYLLGNNVLYSSEKLLP